MLAMRLCTISGSPNQKPSPEQIIPWPLSQGCIWPPLLGGDAPWWFPMRMRMPCKRALFFWCLSAPMCENLLTVQQIYSCLPGSLLPATHYTH